MTTETMKMKRSWIDTLRSKTFWDTLLVSASVFLLWMLVGFWFAVFGYVVRFAVDGFLFGYELMLVHVGFLANKIGDKK